MRKEDQVWRRLMCVDRTMALGKEYLKCCTPCWWQLVPERGGQCIASILFMTLASSWPEVLRCQAYLGSVSPAEQRLHVP